MQQINFTGSQHFDEKNPVIDTVTEADFPYESRNSKL
jgi:hypothetical protein